MLKKGALWILPMLLFAVDGYEVYKKRCASCHVEEIPYEKLRENFMHGNKILHLKAPTINQLSYRLKLRIGDPKGDRDIQEMEVVEFVKEYVKHPDKSRSVCSKVVRRTFKTMEPIRDISDEELEAIGSWIYNHSFKKEEKNGSFDFQKLLEKAKKENKIIVLEAVSSTCHYCHWMEKTTLSDQEVQRILQKYFIYVPVDVTKESLPLGLEWKLTPSFIFIDQNGKVLKKIPGAWEKEDFMKILKEVRK